MNARESLGYWATDNPAPALVIVVLIIGLIAGAVALGRKGGGR